MICGCSGNKLNLAHMGIGGLQGELSNFQANSRIAGSQPPQLARIGKPGGLRLSPTSFIDLRHSWKQLDLAPKVLGKSGLTMKIAKPSKYEQEEHQLAVDISEARKRHKGLGTVDLLEKELTSVAHKEKKATHFKKKQVKEQEHMIHAESRKHLGMARVIAHPVAHSDDDVI